MNDSIQLITNFKEDGSLASSHVELAIIEALYDQRTKSIGELSYKRCQKTALERVRFEALKHFFEDYEWLFNTSLNKNNSLFKRSMQKFDKSNNISLALISERLLFRFQVIWTIFFSNLSTKDDICTSSELSELYLFSQPNKKLIKKKGGEIYEDFLKNNEWSLTKFKNPAINESQYEILFKNHYSLAIHLELSKSEIRGDKDEPEIEGSYLESRLRVSNKGLQ